MNSFEYALWEKQEKGNILNKRVQLLIGVAGGGEGISMNAMNFHKE